MRFSDPELVGQQRPELRRISSNKVRSQIRFFFALADQVDFSFTSAISLQFGHEAAGDVSCDFRAR